MSGKSFLENQSPGLAKSPKGAYLTQLNKITGETKAKRQLDSDDAVVYELMRRRGDEEAHHKVIKETLDVLYRGLNEDEARELTRYFNEYTNIGNTIGNLINIPKSMHQGGIHAFTKANGYEYHPREIKPKGMVEDIIDASEMPLEYRKHIGKEYITKALPQMEEKINELLTEHPAMQEKLDLSAVREAQFNETSDIYGSALDDLIKNVREDDTIPIRKATDKIMDSQAMTNYLNEAGKDLQSTGSVVGQKPFVINADDGAKVDIYTNGNGKDHAIMQERLNRRRR